MNYRRSKTEGGTFFFTVTLQKRNSHLLTQNIAHLKQAFKQTIEKHPFRINAIVILPNHLHTIWTLPENDANFSMRWTLIKSSFSRCMPKSEWLSSSRRRAKQRGIWQRRFWEHEIRNDVDFENHVNYIHFNPVKHGYVKRVCDWPHSSFHRFVAAGVLPQDWGIEHEQQGNRRLV